MVPVKIRDLVKTLSELPQDETVIMTYEEMHEGVEFVLKLDGIDADPEVSNALIDLLDESQIREYASRYGIPEEALRQFMASRAF